MTIINSKIRCLAGCCVVLFAAGSTTESYAGMACLLDTGTVTAKGDPAAVTEEYCSKVAVRIRTVTPLANGGIGGWVHCEYPLEGGGETRWVPWGSTNFTCSGDQYFADYNDLFSDDQGNGQSEPSSCHPINLINGNKYKIHTDLSDGLEQSALKRPGFTRTYNSNLFEASDNQVGLNWRHSYQRTIGPEKFEHPGIHAGLQGGTPDPMQSSVFDSRQQACEQGHNEFRQKYTAGQIARDSRLQKIVNGIAEWTGQKCVIRSSSTGRYLVTIPIKNHTVGYAMGPDFNLELRLVRPDGNELLFRKSVIGTLDPVAWESATPGFAGVVEEEVINTPTPEQPNAKQIIYRYTDENDTTETYDEDGKLLSVEYVNGVIETLSYVDGILDRVDNNLGKYIDIGYNTDGMIGSVTDEAGRVWSYFYDAEDRLERVVNPDMTEKLYHYEDIDLEHALTGLTDERNIRYSTFEYYPDGLARSSYLGAPGAPAELRPGNVSLDYGATSNTMTDSRGYDRTFYFSADVIQGLLERFDGPECINCPDGSASYVYDIDLDDPAASSLNLASKTEYGVQTLYPLEDEAGEPLYDERGNPGRIIEAAGTMQERIKNYVYDARYQHRVESIRESSVFAGAEKLTTFSYDDFGNQTSITIDGYRPDGTLVNRATSFKYEGPFNQLSEIDGPRSDVDDRTIIEYYPDDPLENDNRARVERIVAPEGVIIRDNITYTPTGKIDTYTTDNYLHVDYDYYPGNDRLEAFTLTDDTTGSIRKTHWTYLESGEVASITIGYESADATIVSFGYDDARRLTHIYDGSGNYIEYILDTEGNVIDEYVRDHNDDLKKGISYLYDAYSRLDYQSQMNESVDHRFNENGTLEQIIDGRAVLTGYGYDSLLRLTKIEQDKGGSDSSTANALTQFDYDTQDNLVAAIDANGGETLYVYDDLANLLSQDSPDTGFAAFTYDEAGNVATMTDARGQLFSYTFDGLGRLTGIDAPDDESDVIYAYDECSKGSGFLCSVARGSALLSYRYNAFGDIVSVAQEVVTYPGFETAVAQLSYEYDNAGRTEAITYPSGNRVTTTYNAAGYADGMNLNGTEVILVNNVKYHPFGEVSTQKRGDGLWHWNVVDQAYRSVYKGNAGVFSELAYVYDENGNPTYIAFDNEDHGYQYDAHDRLDLGVGDYGFMNYNYDLVGNRTLLISNGDATSYAYEPKSNRMSAEAGEPVQLDENGNTLSLRGEQLEYTSDNRLAGVTDISEYRYNGIGERVLKAYNKGGASSQVNGYKTAFLYGKDDKLLAESGPTGQVKKEYIYFNGELTAVLMYTPSGGEQVLNADMDADGAIGIDDFLIWYLEQYLPGNQAAEVTGDGIMDVNDLIAVNDCAYGDKCVTSSYDRAIYYAYNDHLGTAHALSDENGVRVWSADYKPFGEATVDEDPDGNGQTVVLNIRFPGQYYDAESGLHYNYFRTYDPGSGRYITSDPIGLLGGLNTFGYVGGNPLFWTDELGLVGWGTIGSEMASNPEYYNPQSNRMRLTDWQRKGGIGQLAIFEKSLMLTESQRNEIENRMRQSRLDAEQQKTQCLTRVWGETAQGSAFEVGLAFGSAFFGFRDPVEKYFFPPYTLYSGYQTTTGTVRCLLCGR